MLKSALFLALFVCYAFSNTIAKNELTMFDGTSCRTIQSGCLECQGKYVTVYSNSDSSVSYIPPTLSCYNGTDVPAVQGSCSTTGFQPCTVFYNPYYQLNTLKVSSQYPVEFYLALCPSPIGGHVSKYGGVLEGAISQVFVSSGNETIHFIQQISQTQYVTSWGVINIGQEYTFGPVTFIFDSKNFTSMPSYLPPVPQHGVSATFNPFGGVFVYDNTKSQKFVYNDLNMALFASNEQSGFRGVELTNAYFGVKDVQLYPPYSDNYEGVWIFRFTNSFGSGYHALPAEMSESGEYRSYECEIGDLSFSFSLGLSWSISIDLGNLPRPQTADSMAFELF